VIGVGKKTIGLKGGDRGRFEHRSKRVQNLYLYIVAQKGRIWKPPKCGIPSPHSCRAMGKEKRVGGLERKDLLKSKKIFYHVMLNRTLWKGKMLLRERRDGQAATQKKHKNLESITLEEEGHKGHLS